MSLEEQPHRFEQVQGGCAQGRDADEDHGRNQRHEDGVFDASGASIGAKMHGTNCNEWLRDCIA